MYSASRYSTDDGERPQRRGRVLPADEKADVLDELTVDESVSEFTFITVGIANHYRTALAWILRVNWHRENTGEPSRHTVPGLSCDHDQMIRDVSLPQILEATMTTRDVGL